MDKKKFMSRIETGGPVEYDFNSDDEGYLYRTDSQIIIHWSVILDFYIAFTATFSPVYLFFAK
jgi:hypothetical protein